MDLTQRITNFFKAKSKNQDTDAAPEGVCPNCWGKQEWEGEYYEQMKAKNVTPESDTYNNWIKEFVTKHIDGIALKEDTYTCTTCKVSFGQ